MSDEVADRPWHGKENPLEALHDWVKAEFARLDGRISALDGPPPVAEPPPVESTADPEPEPDEPHRGGRRGKGS